MNTIAAPTTSSPPLSKMPVVRVSRMARPTDTPNRAKPKSLVVTKELGKTTRQSSVALEKNVAVSETLLVDSVSAAGKCTVLTTRQSRPKAVQWKSPEDTDLDDAGKEQQLVSILNSLPLTPKSRQFLQCTLDRHVIQQREAEFLVAHLHDFVLRRQSAVDYGSSDVPDKRSDDSSQPDASSRPVDFELIHRILIIDWPLVMVSSDAGGNNEELSERLFQQSRDAFCHIIAHNNRLSTVAMFHTVSMFRRYSTVSASSANSISADAYAGSFDEQYFRRVHLLLDACCLAVPLNADSVTVCLSQTHPYRSKPAAEHYCYNRNLLEFIERHPRYRLDVLSSIMQELNDIDHMLPAHAILLAEEKAAGKAESVAMAQPLAETLNISMHLILQFVSKLADKSPVELREIFHHCLQPIFEAVLLRSHYVRHTQYLWFYLASRDSVIREQFLSKLWEKFTSPAAPVVVRQGSVHYLCNFLARSSSVDTDIVLMWLIRILKWCDAYVADSAGRKTGISSTGIENWASSAANSNNAGESASDGNTFLTHVVFFAAVHMALYLLCFRSVGLFADAKSRIYLLERAPLRRIVYSSLNPLRFCSPAVVDFFTEVCRHFHVMLLHPLVEENTRNAAKTLASPKSMPDLCVTAAEQGLDAKRVNDGAGDVHAGYLDGAGDHPENENDSPTKSRLSVAEWRLIRRVYPLVGFFAFEPYLLKRDRALVAKYYKMFNGLAGSDDVDETGGKEARPKNDVAATVEVAAKDDRIQAVTPKVAKTLEPQRVQKRPLPAVSEEKLLALADRRNPKKFKLS